MLGLEPLPCEAEGTGDPDRCPTRMWRCPGYGVCLNEACKHNWKSWTCMACPVYQRYWAGAFVRVVIKVMRIGARG